MRITLAAAAAALLLLPAAAGAQTYPEPKEPGKIAPKPKGPFATHTVCKKQAAATSARSRRRSNAADAGRHDPRAPRRLPRVRDDQRRARSATCGSSATASSPRRVVLDGRGKQAERLLRQRRRPGDDRRLPARNYRANGFFVVNAVGYKLTQPRRRRRPGVYGVYAFNSKGGEMSHSEAYYHSDAGFYIGQTPQQTKPIRSVVRDVESWGNPIGFSAHEHALRDDHAAAASTTTRIGIVPNALESEKFPPAEANVITDNDIFWNNFNVHAGAPFKPQDDRRRAARADRHRRPAARRAHATGSRATAIYGNYLVGVARRRGHPARQDARGARARSATRSPATRSALGGEDRNGRDLAYDGNGTRQLLGPEHRRADHAARPTRRSSRRARSPAPTRSARTRRTSWSATRGAERAEAAGSSTRTRPSPATRRSRSTRSEARPPLLALAGAALVAAPAAAPRRRKPRTVKIADNYYLPAKLTVKPRHAGRLALARRGRRRPRRQARARRPRASSKFQSEPAAGGYSLQAHARRSPGATGSSARSTRR